MLTVLALGGGCLLVRVVLDLGSPWKEWAEATLLALV
jgi:hypothetical protein